MNLGIDLGSGTAIMSSIVDDEPQIILNELGSEVTPTVLCVEEDEVLVGEEALHVEPVNPGLTQRLNRRDLGTETTYEIGGEKYKPQDVLGCILEHLVSVAEEGSNEEIQGATITVPYASSERFRHAIRDAAENTGLNSIEMISEPVAACLGWNIDGEKMDKKSVLVYDLGKQSFDVAIVRISEEQLEVVAADGTLTLGGANFTSRLYEYVKSELLEQGVEPAHIDQRVKKNLRTDVKEAKERLSVHTVISFFHHQNGDVYEIEITRDEFHDLINDLVDETIEITDNLVNSSYAGISNIDGILLTGGSTRMPIIQERIEEYLAMEPRLDMDPTRVIAKGAAVVADRNRPDDFIVE